MLTQFDGFVEFRKISKHFGGFVEFRKISEHFGGFVEFRKISKHFGGFAEFRNTSRVDMTVGTKHSSTPARTVLARKPVLTVSTCMLFAAASLSP